MKIRTMFVALFFVLAVAGFAATMIWFPWVSVIPAAIAVWTGVVLFNRRKSVGRLVINWLLVWRVISVILMVLCAIATVAIAIFFGWWALLAAAAFLGALIWFLTLIRRSAIIACVALTVVVILFGVFCILNSIGVLNVNQLNVGEINADELNATTVNATELNATTVNATEVNATKVNATTVNATEVNATKVNATEVNATKVNATEVNATKVNATEVNATKVNATEVNATKVNATEVNTTKPTTQPTTKPTTKPTTQPTTQPTTKPTTQPTTKPTTKPTTQPTTQPTTKPTTKPTTQVKNPSISVSTDYMQKGDTVIVTLKDATASDVVIKYVDPNTGSWINGGATLKSIGNNQYRLMVEDSLFEMAVDLTLGISGQTNYKMVTLEPCYE